MQKITASWLKKFKPADKQIKHRKDNLQVIVNPTGRVSLTFYFHSDGKQRYLKLNSYKFTPTKEWIDSVQSEYSRLYTHLLECVSANVKAVDDTGHSSRIVYGAEAFEVLERDREQYGSQSDYYKDKAKDWPPLPADYLKQEQRKKDAKSFRRAALAYYEWYDAEGNASVDNERGYLKHLVQGYGDAKGLGDLEPNQIKAHQVQAILDALKKDKSHTPSAVRKCCSRLWRWMKRRGYVESREEVLDLDASEPPPRDRIFSEAEIKILLTDCHSYYRAVALNPLRVVEHTRVHWDHICEENNCTVQVKDSRGKGKKRYHIQPLTDAYIACGRSTREQGGFLFPGRHAGRQLLQNSLSAVGNSWAKEKGIPNHHNHDWRQTFGVWHEKRGTRFEHWDACLSHDQQQGIRKIYGGYQYLAEKREALQEWADYLENLT